MAGSIQERFDKLTQDDDLSLEEFQQYLDEVVPRFVKFTRDGIQSEPEEFKEAMTKGEWMEEFQSFVDYLDGENSST
jgi:hypothetical protein